MRAVVKHFSGKFENFFKKFFCEKFSQNVIFSQKSDPFARERAAKNHPINEWLFVGGTLSMNGAVGRYCPDFVML